MSGFNVSCFVGLDCTLLKKNISVDVIFAHIFWNICHQRWKNHILCLFLNQSTSKISCNKINPWVYTGNIGRNHFCLVLSAKSHRRCPVRDVSQISSGRRCRKSCRTDNDCIGSQKRCMCDNVCGYSCFNPGRLFIKWHFWLSRWSNI